MNTRKALLASVAHRFWSAAAGLITLWFISRYLSSDEQGYYYSFTSLLTLQIVFELGFSVVLVQFAAHEAAFLVVKSDGDVTGDPYHLERLKSLMALALQWYAGVAAIVLLLVSPAGWMFFERFSTSSTVEWQLAWLCSAAGLAMVISVTGAFAVLEGLGQIHRVASVRLMQDVTGYLLFWAAAWSGHGLLSFPCLFLGRLVVVVLVAWFSPWGIWILEAVSHRASSAPSISWKHDILPFQWRIGLSWLSGFFIFSLLSPMAFAFSGAAAAGQLGATMALFGGVATVAILWISVQVPLFAQIAARRDYLTLEQLFGRKAIQSMLVCIAGIISALALLELLARYEPVMRLRFLPWAILIWLLPTVVINQLVSSIAAILRCEKKEPLLWPSVGCAFAMVTLSALVAPEYGVRGLLMIYLVTNLLIPLPAALILLKRAKARWRSTVTLQNPAPTVITS